MKFNTTVLFAKLAFSKHTGKCVDLPPATDQSSSKTVYAGTTKALAPALAAVSRGFNPAHKCNIKQMRYNSSCCRSLKSN
jgi:hypothetical protein